ncbi:SAM-dependent methyltransferase [Nocardia sp. NPDC051030]|uniref:class I SAM-dependent methyltransferase n=1 Tax=Nocardia sp. NPDC051030 TaxID=3155162 RepID=UPI00342458A9
MRIGQPSRTALATAYARAYHQIANEPRIFTDPMAIRIAGASPEKLIDMDANTLTDPGAAAIQYRRRLFVAARARFADDTIAEAVAAGARQVVVLGAGLDTFAYRNPYPGVRVFEVDHPDTQAWKRDRLETAGIPLPDSLTFTPVDFETQTLAAGLSAVGFDRDQPAVFVWLGVVMYLTEQTVLDTLRFIADQAAPTRVVFDYLCPADPDSPAEIEFLRERSARVAALGEPWLCFLTPVQIESDLRTLGFNSIEDLDSLALIQHYAGIPAPTSTLNPPHVLRAGRTTAAPTQ